MEKQVIDIRERYHQNYVKLNSNACEANAITHENNLQPYAKDNQINSKKAVTNPTLVKSQTKLSKCIPGQKDHAL